MESLLLAFGIDALLIIVFAVSIISSMRRGFLSCILSLVCAAVALFAAINLSQPASEWTYDNVLSGYVVNEVEKAMTEGFDSQAAASTVSQVIEMIPDMIVNQLEDFGIDIGELSKNISEMQLSAKDTAEKISYDIIRPGALVLLKMLCFVLLFVAIRFVLGILSRFVEKVAKLPLLKGANRTLGALVGAIKGVVIAVALCMLANFLAALSGEDSTVAVCVENSRICNAVSSFEFSDLGKIDFTQIGSDTTEINN